MIRGQSETKKSFSRAFTIVELVVVIAVISILASLVAVGFGKWQKQTAENVVKFDLTNVASVMETARNFNNAYPPAIPSSFKASDSVVVVGGGSGDGKTYCIQATSTVHTDVSMIVSNASPNPQVGNCSASSGLVAWFPMNGSASDLSGKGNHGTAVSVTPMAGQNGASNGAYAFTGVGSYIVHATNGILPSSGTLSVWVYPTVQNGWGIWQTHNSTSVNWLDWIAMFAYSSGTTYFRMGNGSACCSNDLTYSTASYIPVNQWTLLTFSWGGGSMKNYRNGALINQRVATFQGVMDPFARIGTGHGAGMQGRMDDLRIYDRQLSDNEIDALYSAGAQ